MHPGVRRCGDDSHLLDFLCSLIFLSKTAYFELFRQHQIPSIFRRPYHIAIAQRSYMFCNFHTVNCAMLMYMKTTMMIGVARIFAARVHYILPQKLLTIFRYRAQYTAHPLPSPINHSHPIAQ